MEAIISVLIILRKNGSRSTKGRVKSILRFTRNLTYPRKLIVADLNRMLHFKWLIRYQRMALGKTKAVQSLKKKLPEIQL